MMICGPPVSVSWVFFVGLDDGGCWWFLCSRIWLWFLLLAIIMLEVLLSGQFPIGWFSYTYCVYYAARVIVLVWWNKFCRLINSKTLNVLWWWFLCFEGLRPQLLCCSYVFVTTVHFVRSTVEQVFFVYWLSYTPYGSDYSGSFDVISGGDSWICKPYDDGYSIRPAWWWLWNVVVWNI